MDLATLYFNTIGSDIYLIVVEAAFAIGSFYLWRKHRHKDYFWLATLWVVLLLNKGAEYLFDTVVIPNISLSLYFYLVFLFNLLTTTVSWIALFYIGALLSKWYVRRTERSEEVLKWLMHPFGIATVVTATLVANIALTLYIASTAVV